MAKRHASANGNLVPVDPSRARAALEAELGKHNALLHVVVHERNGFATFANVPLASLELFAGALKRAKLPPLPEPKHRRVVS